MKAPKKPVVDEIDEDEEELTRFESREYAEQDDDYHETAGRQCNCEDYPCCGH